MKRAIFALGLLLVVAGLVACRKSASGTYAKENSNVFIELKADGSFYAGTSRQGMWGKYTIEGDVITFMFEGGRATRARLQGNTIVDEDETTWVRQAERALVPSRGGGAADDPRRIASNQASAVGSLRTINTAQITYASTYNAGYSRNLQQLGPGASAPNANRAGLIDEVLASGTKAGYRFVYTPGAQAAGGVDTYQLFADPIQPGVTGNYYYYTDHSGVIRQNTSQRAGPNDPPIAG